MGRLKGQQEKEVTITNKEGASKFPAYKYLILMARNILKLGEGVRGERGVA